MTPVSWPLCASLLAQPMSSAEPTALSTRHVHRCRRHHRLDRQLRRIVDDAQPQVAVQHRLCGRRLHGAGVGHGRPLPVLPAVRVREQAVGREGILAVVCRPQGRVPTEL